MFKFTDGYSQELHIQEDREEAEKDAAYESDTDYDGEDEEGFDDSDDEEGAADDDSAPPQYTFQDECVPQQRPAPPSYLACSTPKSPKAMTRRRLNLGSASCTRKGQQKDKSDADSTAMESAMAEQTGSVDTPSTTDSGCEDPTTLATRSKAVPKTLRGKRYVRVIDTSDTEAEQTAAPKTKTNSGPLAPVDSVILPCDICLREFLITGQKTVMDFAGHKVQCLRLLKSRQRFLRMRRRLERRMAGIRGDTSSDESMSDNDCVVGTKTIKRH
ncbi:hypothetical protein BGZ70_000407 [Mortierella alpina]|uniref:Uncharacterized protein n=1 Tax=Mortierella alpina TaxID=64518 RepID=A0A9P6LYZ3_MORAP|nr:hypothetical protein BGZ70_000407 [Mortierella alpina]